jgi:hypothetical protein
VQTSSTSTVEESLNKNVDPNANIALLPASRSPHGMLRLRGQSNRGSEHSDLAHSASNLQGNTASDLSSGDRIRRRPREFRRGGEP